MGSKNAPEPAPKLTQATPAWELTIKFVQENYEDDDGTEVHDLLKDMFERDRIGRAKYGTPLQAGNGRKPLVDAYQEGLDQAVYLRQYLDEQGIDPDGTNAKTFTRNLTPAEEIALGMFRDMIENLVDLRKVI